MSITLSPDGRLAATTDEFGRVMLIRVKEGIVLRTWKGIKLTLIRSISLRKYSSHKLFCLYEAAKLLNCSS